MGVGVGVGVAVGVGVGVGIAAAVRGTTAAISGGTSAGPLSAG